ncbi:MAG: Holliday junction branch migration protein RuvA [Ignavibacteriales bacterium]|nr:Holliday junction branch migration protein RuvA [Ignavibacteriales bacterium]
MIASLTGILKAKSPTEILIDVGGVGYAVSIPVSTFEKLGNVESEITLLTYLNVRDDALQLFGFATNEERFLFKQLISVSGIGPRIAQGILSGISVADLRIHLVNGNVSALTAIPGVGRKTAERLIVELRDKLTKADLAVEASLREGGAGDARTQAFMALVSLGFSKPAAEKAIVNVLKESDGKDLAVEELVKKALRIVTTR